MESRIAKAIRHAHELAATRGHKLGDWGFRNNQAANRCEREGCGCSVLVTPGDALEVLGAAIMLACREGGNAALEAPQPAPSGPVGLELPAAAPRAANELQASRELQPVPVSFGRKKVTA
jgi:hypothetical protein